jgi:hypothetical protein
MRRGSSLKMGKIYRLTFPGIAARVIEPPANVQVGKYPYLVESLILRSRWWVNERGEPDNIHTPHLIQHPMRALRKPQRQRLFRVRYPAESSIAASTDGEARRTLPP